MNILSPSILSADFTILGQQIQAAGEAGAGYLHIDVMDGMFVPSISFGMPVIRSIRKATDAIFDVHMMVEKPERYIDEFAECGADIITFHLEACENAGETIRRIHELGRKAGISIKPGTPVESLIPYLEEADMILLMTVEPGFGGQKYMEGSTERIRRVRELIEQKGCRTDIEVDGGITIDNVQTVLEAGANVIVAGSSVFRGDICKNVKAMLQRF